jgi:hypothetical protein
MSDPQSSGPFVRLERRLRGALPELSSHGAAEPVPLN